MEDDRNTSDIRVLKRVLFAALLFGGAAFLLQVFSPLPLSYTFFEPLEILQTVVLRPGFPTLIGSISILGLSVNPLSARLTLASFRKHFLETDRKCLRLLLVFLVASASFSLAPDYVLIDRVVLVVIGLCLSFWVTRARLSAVAFELVVVLLLFVVVSYGFTVVKAALFMVCEPNDAYLIALEQKLFGAPAHRTLAPYMDGKRSLLVLFDEIYFRLFDHMAVVSLFLATAGLRLERYRYLSSLALCYMIGAFSYYVLPSLGPIFMDQTVFGYLQGLDLLSLDMQRALFDNSVAARERLLGELRTYEFLAAMPSLHMAHEFVMLWYARHSPLFFLISLAFTAVTSVAVVALGWHYAIDIAGGAILAVVAVWITGKASRSVAKTE